MTGPMQQLPLRLSPGPSPGFDSFCVGPNAAALAALQAEPLPATPVYLWGEAGSGKSHLLQAVARWRQEAHGERVGAFDAASPTPWTWDAAWSAALIDGCEALDAARQHAAFALFVEASTQGVPVLAAGRLPPVDLPLREDLRTRLGWGLVFHLEPPSEAEVRAALRRDADRRGLFLSDEVMGYLLTRFPRGLASLLPLLARLDDYALGEQRRLTVPLIKQMLAQPPHADGAPG